MKYNTRLEVFPSNIIAGMFHFEQADSFSVTEARDREVPQVSFNTGSTPDASDTPGAGDPPAAAAPDGTPSAPAAPSPSAQ